MTEAVERQLKISKRTAGTAPGIGKKRQLESNKSGVALPRGKGENAPQLLPPLSKRWLEEERHERRAHARARLHQLLHSAVAHASAAPHNGQCFRQRPFFRISTYFNAPFGNTRP